MSLNEKSVQVKKDNLFLDFYSNVRMLFFHKNSTKFNSEFKFDLKFISKKTNIYIKSC